MEFNQDNRSFCTPVTVLDTVAEQLADVDFTLPDYCPDIEKILKCTLVPKIQTRSLSGGQLQVEGYCIVNVMYVENINKTIRCCEQSVNFSQNFSVKETPDNPVIITKTKSEYINCRALSPRRLVIHGAFSLYAKVFSSTQTNLFASDNINLQTNKLSVRCADLKSFCQEQFSVCEEVVVSDKPTIETILHSNIGVSVTDVKAVTGKLMINGEINLKMFFLSDVETGTTGKIDYLLPFNQIIDCRGVDEKTINCVSCDVMSYDIRLKNDILSEKPSVILDVKLCVTEEGYVIDDEEIISDAYSVDFNSNPAFEHLEVINEVLPVNENFMQKLNVNVDDGKISKILDIYTDYISAEYHNHENNIVITGKINICMIALNDEGSPVFIERSMDYEHILNSVTDCNALIGINAGSSSISYRLVDDNTVELRCEIKVSANAMKKSSFKAVKGVEIFEDKPIEGDSCALVLYFAKKGENLWDIAKSHNTKLDLLLNENSTENLTLNSSQMLLIPRI